MSLENKIKSKFDSYSPEVPEEVWGNISEKLNKRKAIGLFSRRLMLAASILLLLLAGASYLIINNITSTQNVTAPLAQDQDNLQNNKIQTPENNENLGKNQNSEPATNNSNTLLADNTDYQKTGKILRPKTKSQAYSDNKNANSEDTENPESTERPNKYLLDELSSVAPNVATAALPHELEQAENIILKSHLATFAKTHENDKTQKKSEIALSLGLGTGAMSTNSSSSNTKGVDIIQPKRSYSNLYNGNVGLSLKRGRVGLSSGIAYIQHSQSSLISSTSSINEGDAKTLVRAQKNGSNTLVLNTIAGKVKAPINNSSASLLFSPDINGRSDVMMSYDDELYISQNYGYLEVPLEASYDILAKNRFSLAVVGGGAVGFLANNRARAKEGANNYNLGATENLSNLSLRANLGISVSFGINNNTAVEIQPYYSKYLNSINESSVSYTPSVIGIRTILNLDF